MGIKEKLSKVWEDYFVPIGKGIKSIASIIRQKISEFNKYRSERKYLKRHYDMPTRINLFIRLIKAAIVGAFNGAIEYIKTVQETYKQEQKSAKTKRELEEKNINKVE